MQGTWKVARGYVVLAVLVGVLVLTGCPPGTRIVMEADGIQVSGNCWPYAGNSAGWRYVPIGGITTWTVLNPRDYDEVYTNGQRLILPDSVPDSKIRWTFAGWSTTPTQIGKTVTARAIDSPYTCPYPGPNSSCLIDDVAKPPLTDDPATNRNLYGYTDVVLPYFRQECAYDRNPSGPDVDWGYQIKLMDNGGDASTISWSHCTLDETNLQWQVNDCNFPSVHIGGTGINSDNKFGDELHNNMPASLVTCTATFTTDWSISSGGPWYKIETATYSYTLRTVNGQAIRTVSRNGVAPSGLPACAGPL